MNNIEISINAAKRYVLRRIWRFIGYDEANYTYTTRGRELLGKLGTMSDSSYYTRCHFMLCTGDGTGRPKWGSTNVYTEDDYGNPVYSFDIVDKIIDTQIKAGCIPFLELGFMPEALTTAPAGVPYNEIWDAGWSYPPKDYSRWADLIRTFARHCIKRYGLREVSRWYWELWNEPDISYWKGTINEYNRLYDFTELALHSVIPEALLGGPAVTGPNNPKAGKFLNNFLEHCVHGENAVTGKTGTRLDIITFHAKGGGYQKDHDASKETPTIKRLIDHIKSGLDIISQYPELKGLEINLSECDPDGWAAGGKYDNPNLNFRNTEYYSSYVANTVCKLIDINSDGPNRIDGMLTWAFQFENRDYFEGLRTLSTNGIDKAILNVFRLLARLGGVRLHLVTNNSINSNNASDGNEGDLLGLATSNELGVVHIFISHHHDDWNIKEPKTVNISIEGLLPSKSYSVIEWKVDKSNANAYTRWVEMGSPQKPTTEQIEQLHLAAMLKPEKKPSKYTDGKGRMEIETIVVDTHSVNLIEITPEIQ